MLPETTKPTTLSSSDHDGVELDSHKKLHREIKDMVNTLTHRLAGLHRPVASQRDHDHPDEATGDDHGISIVTLAGNNSGTTMRTDLEDKPNHPPGLSLGDSQPDAVGTYLNSNFQAVNNSIMLRSTYNANDPGVHMDISDTYEQNALKPDKHARKGKKKVDKESFNSDQQSAFSD